MTKKLTHVSSVQTVKYHFGYVGVLLLGLILFDVWKLIPIDQLRVRWFSIIALFAITSILFQISTVAKKDIHHRAIIYVLIVLDIALASMMIYLERGISSASVILFAVPLAASSALLNSRGILTTALLCVAGYASACTAYFLDNQFEELRVRFYGTVVFYGCVMVVISLMLANTKRS